MKRVLKNVSIIAIAVLFLFSFNTVDSNAAVKLSAKKLTMVEGETKTLSVKNCKKKVSWSISSGKSVVKLSDKEKTKVCIRAIKAGKAKVVAKVGKKKYTCSITVKGMSVKSIDYVDKHSWFIPEEMKDAAPVKYIFIESNRYKRITCTLNTDFDYQTDYDLGNIRINYSNGKVGTVDYDNVKNVKVDYSGVDFNTPGHYKLLIYYENVSCEVTVVVSEKKTKGVFEYLTDGTYAVIKGVRGDDIKRYDYDGKPYTGPIEEEDTLEGGYEYENYYVEERYTGSELVFPEELDGASVVQIEASTGFGEKNSIKKVVIPSKVEDTGYGVCLSGLKSLVQIEVASSNATYSVIDGVLYSLGGRQMVWYPSGKSVSSFSIPEGTLSIISLFSDNIKELYIPSSLKAIGNACMYCRNLEKIIVDPNNKTYVASGNVLKYIDGGVAYDPDEEVDW